MANLANRSLLIASYCIISVNLAIELIAHPRATDHADSVVGLVLCLLVLVALIKPLSSTLIRVAAVLNALMVLVGIWILGTYTYLHGISWNVASDVVVRVYFAIVVPAFSFRYFYSLLRPAR